MNCTMVKKLRDPISELKGFTTFELKNFNECIIKCKYDGCDILAYYIDEKSKRLSLEDKINALCGLFSPDSNFKNCLFEAYSNLKGDKCLEYIFFKPDKDLDEVIEICSSSSPANLTLQYFKSKVFSTLVSDDKKIILETDDKVAKLFVFLAEEFSKTFAYRRTCAKYSNYVFLYKDDEIQFQNAKEKEMQEKFQEFIKRYEFSDGTNANELLKLCED